MVRRMAEPMSDPRWGVGGLIFNLILAFDSYLGRPRVDRLIGNRRQRNIERLGSRTGSTPVEGPVSSPLEEMTERDPELFRSQHLKRSKPVLLSGLLSDSSVLSEWDSKLLSGSLWRSHGYECGRRRSVGLRS